MRDAIQHMIRTPAIVARMESSSSTERQGRNGIANRGREGSSERNQAERAGQGAVGVIEQREHRHQAEHNADRDRMLGLVGVLLGAAHGPDGGIQRGVEEKAQHEEEEEHRQ